jgi:hypothetical protein
MLRGLTLHFGSFLNVTSRRSFHVYKFAVAELWQCCRMMGCLVAESRAGDDVPQKARRDGIRRFDLRWWHVLRHATLLAAAGLAFRGS